MDLTAGTRATAVSAAVVMALGMGVVLYGVAVNDLSRALGGACLTMTTLTLIALVAIRRWTTNTDAERRRLADATRETDTERMRYVAGRAAMEVERDRMHRDAASQRAKLDQILKVERARIREQLEEERAEISTDALEGAFRMLRAGLCDPSVPVKGRGTVIDFPEQPQPSEQPAAVRPRGH